MSLSVPMDRRGQHAGLLDLHPQWVPGVAIRPQRDEAIAMPIPKRPERRAVRFREGQMLDGGAGKKAESPLVDRRRQR